MKKRNMRRKMNKTDKNIDKVLVNKNRYIVLVDNDETYI